jgi:NAD(P)-dependent dehydrogenase (short-subunit alcohol dehydrogenase family)
MTAHAVYPSLYAKRVFITGGASGIGAALVDAFAAQGAAVAFVDINTQAGRALARDLQASGGPQPISFTPCDVTDVAALQSTLQKQAEAMGGLDVLINNVASDQRHQTETLSPASWRANLAINLDPTFFATQAALPFLQAAVAAAVINISSLNAFLGPADMPAYAAAKSAILGLTKAQAREFGQANIRVNAIVPGWVDTPAQRERGWLTPQTQAAWIDQCALKSLIEPSDVARLAMFLASNEARMITGQSFVIDAGRT